VPIPLDAVDLTSRKRELSMSRVWTFDALGGPEQMHLGTEELPVLGATDARVRIRTVGLNRSDLLWMAGRYIKPPIFPGAHIGQEAVGEVTEVGSEPQENPFFGRPLKLGDRVVPLVGRVDFQAMGTYRDEGIYPQTALLPVPEKLHDVEAAGLWIAALTALGGWQTAGIDEEAASGKTVAVTAASSGVGIVALQIARAWGARTVAVTTSPEKEAALAAEADSVLVVPRGDGGGDGFGSALAEICGGGFDAAFDPVGYANAVSLYEAAGSGAQIVYYGIMAGSSAPLDMVALLRKNLGVHGYTIYRLFQPSGRLEGAVRTIQELVDSGDLRPRVAAEYALEEAPAALLAMNASEHLGKIVLKC